MNVVTREHVGLYRLLAIRSALKLEMCGKKMSTGMLASTVCKKEFGFRGGNDALLKQLENKIREDFPGALEQVGEAERIHSSRRDAA